MEKEGEVPDNWVSEITELREENIMSGFKKKFQIKWWEHILFSFPPARFLYMDSLPGEGLSPHCDGEVFASTPKSPR